MFEAETLILPAAQPLGIVGGVLSKLVCNLMFVVLLADFGLAGPGGLLAADSESEGTGRLRHPACPTHPREHSTNGLPQRRTDSRERLLIIAQSR